MKVLHLSTFDLYGGAAKAAFRLNKGLREYGIDSLMLVQKKTSDSPFIIGYKHKLWDFIFYISRRIEKLQFLLYLKKKNEIFSINNIPNFFLIKKIKKIDPDIIHLHWINKRFISIKQLKSIFKLNKKIVWTLHDSWLFTGGCHIPHDCEKYIDKCGKCPILRSNSYNDLSRKIWNLKNKILTNIDFTLVTPSNWLKNCAKNSSLLKNKNIVIIQNSIDLNLFKNIDKYSSKNKLNLDKKKKYLLFGAMSATTDKNKGFDLLIESLKYLKNNDNIELLVFGNKIDLNINSKITVKYFGVIDDIEILNYLYSAADVSIIPSRSESFSLVALESLSSGTPVVAFNIGGLQDIIDHKINGYKATPFDVFDLANGIDYCLSNDLTSNIRDKIEKLYSEDVIIQETISLYKGLLNI